MKSAVSRFLTLGLFGLFAASEGINSGVHYKSKTYKRPLTPAQKKRRAKNKRAKKARKLNRKK